MAEPGWTESERLAALHRYDILDSPPEPEFDDAVALVRTICDVPIALVSLVDSGRQWFKAKVGTEAHETAIDTSVCALAIRQSGVFQIEDLSRDPRTAQMSLVTGDPKIRFYAGSPLVTSDGLPLGSLCAIDVHPRAGGLTEDQSHALAALGRQVIAHIELRSAITERDRAITQQEKRQRQATRDSEILQTMLRAQQRVLHAGGDFDSVLQALTEAALDAVRPAQGVVVEMRDGDDMVYRAGAGAAIGHVGLRFPIAGSFSGLALNDEVTIVSGDTANDHRADNTLVLNMGIRSHVIVPLTRQGKIFAALKMFSAIPNVFKSRHILVGQMLGGLIAASFTESAEAAAIAAAEHSAQSYRHIVDSAIDSAIISTDERGLITSWSRGAQTIMGWTEAEIVGQPLATIFTAEDNAIGRCASEMDRATREGRASDERWHIRKDGTRFYAHGAVTPLLAPARGFVKSLRDITDEHATRSALDVSRERLELATRAAQLGSFDYQPQTGQLDWDDRCRALFGLPPGVAATYESAYLAGLHPDDRDRAAAAVTEALNPAGSGVFDIEYRTVGIEDGIERTILAKGMAFFTAGVPERLIGTVQDVTADRAARRQLLETERELQALNRSLAVSVTARTEELDRLWDTSPDLLVALAFDGTIGRVNPAWTQILGYRADELIGHHVNEFVVEDDIALAAQALVEAAGGPMRPVENRYRHKDGTARWVSWVAAPTENQIYATGRHITAAKEAEDALRKAEEQLRQSQKVEAIGQLTGGVAHDFNNLLTVIRGSTDLLRRADLSDAKRLRYLDAISDTAERATRLTSQLLAFARRSSLQPVVFDAGANVRSLHAMLGTLTGSMIDVVVEVADAPSLVNADPSQFDTAIVNMAVNARDAMDRQGRLTIRVETVDHVPAIRNHPHVRGDYVAVFITDTGSGIAPDQIDQIFEPFFTTKDVGQGTGLGLSQVFGFAKQSGGEIVVESTPGAGTTFTLYLPVAHVEAPIHDPAGPSPAAEPRHARVLVVEDNADVGTFATNALAELGHVTVFARDGEQALALLARDATAFDAVFSDVVMPGMSGIELGQQIRRLYPGLPVLLTSGYSSVLVQEGTHGFELLQKPYSLEELSHAIQRVMTGREPVGERL